MQVVAQVDEQVDAVVPAALFGYEFLHCRNIKSSLDKKQPAKTLTICRKDSKDLHLALNATDLQMSAHISSK